MSTNLTHYNEVKHLLRVGDGIATWGDAPISGIIEGLTGGGPSHWETVIQSVHPNDGRPDVEVFGSTLGGGINGCYRRPLSVTLEKCKYATAYPLAESYRKILTATANLESFYAAVGRWTDSVKYDLAGLLREFLPDLLNQSPSNAMFCSAAGFRLYEEAGLICPGINYSTLTPAAMCRLGMASTQLALVGKRGVTGFKSCVS